MSERWIMIRKERKERKMKTKLQAKEVKRVKMTLKDKKWMLLLFVGMLMLTGIPALFLNMGLVVDELGTMANPAFLAGYNWEEAVASSGGYYYKYGQTLLYILPFCLIKDSVILYRTLIFINAICISVTPVIAYMICRKHLLISSEKISAIFAAVSTMLPAVMLNSLYVRADVMLCVLSWVTAYFLLECYRAETKKYKIRYSILLAMSAMYNFMCHTRGIVEVIAVVIVIILVRWFKKEKVVHLPAFSVTLLIIFVIDRILTPFFKLAIWGENGVGRATTVETFYWGYLLNMLTVSGIKSLIKMAIGWLFNAFTSTAGLVTIGLIAAFMIIWLWLKKSEKISGETGILSLFGLLNFLGCLAMGMLFFFNVVHRYFLGTYKDRGDRIIYDRYLIGAYGILCLLALYELIWKRDIFNLKAKIVTVLGYLTVLVLFIFGVAPYLNGRSVTMRYFIALNVFTDMKKGAVAGIFDNLSTSIIQIGIIMFIVFLIIMIISMGKRAIGLCGVILLSSLTLYTINYKKIRYDEDAKRFNAIAQIHETINPIKEIADDYEMVYVIEGAVKTKTYQILLKEFKIIDEEFPGIEQIGNMFIISKELPKADVLTPGTYYIFKEFDYDKSDNIILVKGEELKEKLESMGVVLETYAESK